MNCADPFFERDATGWQFINLATGNVDLHYNLYNITSRTVAFNAKTGRPEKHRRWAGNPAPAPAASLREGVPLVA